MKIKRLYAVTVILLCILLVGSNLYQWNRQSRIKENVGEMITQRLGLVYDAVNWELSPDTDVSSMPDLKQDLEVLQNLTGIYAQFLGNRERDKNVLAGMATVGYLLEDYTTVYRSISNGLPYNQSKELLESMSAYLSLVTDISNSTQQSLDERFLAFYHAESDAEMISKYGSLSEIRSTVISVSGIHNSD